MAKINFKNLIKKISSVGGRDKLKIPLRPYRDWGILLALFFVLLVFISAANMYLFIQINKEGIFAKERPIEEEIEMLNIEKLESTIGLFNEKTENFENLINQKPDIVDPSL